MSGLFSHGRMVSRVRICERICASPNSRSAATQGESPRGSKFSTSSPNFFQSAIADSISGRHQRIELVETRLGCRSWIVAEHYFIEQAIGQLVERRIAALAKSPQNRGENHSYQSHRKDYIGAERDARSRVVS